MSVVERPIFIGGTGRSGTTVLAQLISTHPDVIWPIRENKIIVEAGGLRDLVEGLSANLDPRRNHLIVQGFIHKANVLRNTGFRSPYLKIASKLLRKGAKIANFGRYYKKPIETDRHILNLLPKSEYSLHQIGHQVGIDH